MMEFYLPGLDTGNQTIDKAFRIAIGDLVENVKPFKAGLLERSEPVIMAGFDYDRPWTRDAAINAWNGATLIMPEVSRNTLISVLDPSDDKLRIGGQYWDAIIWVTGAWWHYLYTGDKEFLSLALEATSNSLEYFEQNEFDTETNLFRGPACYGDGVAAYPDVYANTGGSGSILDWPKHNSDKTAKTGFGIPMHALSTNCLYYNAYVTAEKMAKESRVTENTEWVVKAENLKKAIDKYFWIEGKGYYRYLVDSFGNCDHQEGLGHSFILLFGLADKSHVEALLKKQYISDAGIPCVWPTFSRYKSKDGQSFGRHSGTVWPHVQGFWANAAAMYGKVNIFSHELFKLAQHACRDSQFTEIYHPINGQIYGGMQEGGLQKDKGISICQSRRRQTWSATAFLRMIFMGLVGMRFDPARISFEPCVPAGISHIELSNLKFRDLNIDILIEGNGTKLKSFSMNGKSSAKVSLPTAERGKKKIKIVMCD